MNMSDESERELEDSTAKLPSNIQKEVDQMLGVMKKIAGSPMSQKERRKVVMHHLASTATQAAKFFAMMQGMLNMEHLEMQSVLQTMCHESVNIENMGIPFSVNEDDEGMGDGSSQQNTPLSMTSLMKGILLDSIMPALLEGHVQVGSVRILIAEMEELEKSEESVDDSNPEELVDKYQKEKKRKRLAFAKRSLSKQLSLLRAANKIEKTTKYMDEKEQLCPFHDEALMHLYGYNRNGFIPCKKSRNPKLVTGYEIQHIMLELEKVMAARENDILVSKRKRNKFSKKEVEGAIVKARKLMGGKLPSEDGLLTDTQALRLIGNEDDDSDPIYGTGCAGPSEVSYRTKVRLQQSNVASKDNRTEHNDDAEASHFFVNNTNKIETLAASYALKDLESIINNMGVPNLSCALPAFRALRKKLKMTSLNGPEKKSDGSPTKAQTVLLVDTESRVEVEKLQHENKKPHVVAPGILWIENLITEDLERNFMIAMNKAPFCIDGKNAGNGHMRFAFRRHDPTKNLFPMMSVGSNKAIIGDVPLDEELLYMQANNQWQAIVTNAVNHHICNILKKPEPKPDVGMRHRNLRLYLAMFQPQSNGSIQVLADRGAVFRFWENCDWGQDSGADTTYELNELFHDTIPGCDATPVKGDDSFPMDTRSVIDVITSKDTEDMWGRDLVPHSDINSLLFNAKKSGGFGWHQDVNADRGNQLCSPPHRRDFSNDGKVCYPEPRHMMVSTNVFQTERNKTKATVSWSEGRKLNASTHLATVMPTSRGNHFQCTRANVDNTYHGAMLEGHGNGPENKGGCRIAVSARTAKDFTRDFDLATEAHFRDGYGYDNLTGKAKRNLTVLNHYNSHQVFTGKAQPLPDALQRRRPLYFDVEERARDFILDENRKFLMPQRVQVLKQQCFQFEMLSEAQAALFHQKNFPPLIDATTNKLTANNSQEIVDGMLGMCEGGSAEELQTWTQHSHCYRGARDQETNQAHWNEAQHSQPCIFCCFSTGAH